MPVIPGPSTRKGASRLVHPRHTASVCAVWMHRVGNLSSVPDVPAIAQQPDSYNGSYNKYQIHRGTVYDYWEMYVWLQVRRAPPSQALSLSRHMRAGAAAAADLQAGRSDARSSA